VYYFAGNKNVDSVITAGNFWCEISDHLPNLVLLENTKERAYCVQD